jgi:hypothetical protein
MVELEKVEIVENHSYVVRPIEKVFIKVLGTKDFLY